MLASDKPLDSKSKVVPAVSAAINKTICEDHTSPTSRSGRNKPDDFDFEGTQLLNKAYPKSISDKTTGPKRGVDAHG